MSRSFSTVLEQASNAIQNLSGQTVGIISLGRPEDLAEAIFLSKIVSKQTPMIGNLLEYAITHHLNKTGGWPSGTQWVRQDPGFPDIILHGYEPVPAPGIEVKGWYPLSTEITGRFRESETNLAENNVKLAVVCWLPENIVYGRPMIIG